MSRRYTVTQAGVAHAVELLGGGEVRVDGLTLRVEDAGAGRCLVVDADGRRTLVTTAGSATAPWLFAAGRVWRLEVAPEGSRPARASGADDDMTAPMPATVVTIAAGPGVQVAAGDPVIVLEAMKMELVVRAPRAGQVTAVHCRVGEIVRPGTRLAELAP